MFLPVLPIQSKGWECKYITYYKQCPWRVWLCNHHCQLNSVWMARHLCHEDNDTDSAFVWFTDPILSPKCREPTSGPMQTDRWWINAMFKPLLLDHVCISGRVFIYFTLCLLLCLSIRIKCHPLPNGIHILLKSISQLTQSPALVLSNHGGFYWSSSGFLFVLFLIH